MKQECEERTEGHLRELVEDVAVARELRGDGGGGSWGPAATCAASSMESAKTSATLTASGLSFTLAARTDATRGVRLTSRDLPLNRGRRNCCPSGRPPHEIRLLRYVVGLIHRSEDRISRAARPEHQGGH